MCNLFYPQINQDSCTWKRAAWGSHPHWSAQGGSAHLHGGASGRGGRARWHTPGREKGHCTCIAGDLVAHAVRILREATLFDWALAWGSV